MTITKVLALIAFLVAEVHAGSKSDAGPVTCGSVIKLQHKETGNDLHSHAIAWGSGSGQQSVTTNTLKTDRGSLWLVKESSKSESCEAGTPIRCNDFIRLEHIDTGKNLHSHLFRAPLSGNQEVSGFGDGGSGDTGDNWQIVCDTKDQQWMRYKPVYLVHADTGKYLSTSDSYKFTAQNCGQQCPIMHQTEVSASPKRDVKAKWQTDQGVYFPDKNKNGHKKIDETDEDL